MRKIELINSIIVITLLSLFLIPENTSAETILTTGNNSYYPSFHIDQIQLNGDSLNFIVNPTLNYIVQNSPNGVVIASKDDVERAWGSSNFNSDCLISSTCSGSKTYTPPSYPGKHDYEHAIVGVHITTEPWVLWSDTTYDFSSYFNEALPPLLVPSIKQINPFWKAQVYDSAKKWSPSDPTIGTWGCALTSATMVLNYYNILKLPDSSFITPSTLNKWLISQKDGYLGNGNLNWLAISRLSKIAKNSGHNPNFSNDALEFQRTGSNNKNQLTTDLQNGQPDILEEPGHFTVAKGIKDSTFLINDPFYSYTTLADGYNNSFISLNRFIPSNTDLSYILITGTKLNDLAITDSHSNSHGETFLQNPLENDYNSSQKAGDLTRELLFKNPSSGEYTLKISSLNNSLYSFDIYLYNTDGNPNIKTVSGLTSNDNPDYITISYDHDNNDYSTAKKVVTFDTVIKDINEAISLRKIDKTLGNSLISLLNSTRKLSQKNKSIAQATLKSGQTIIKSSKPLLLSKDIYPVLNDDFTFLLKTL